MKLMPTPRWSPFRRRSLRYGATSEFMNGFGYTTMIELAEPLACLSRRSRAKTDRRGFFGSFRHH